jgi:adenylate cyclase
VNEWNQAEGYPSIQMGIGIHTGEAIVGCIGSEARMKYDVIGRNMNLASRVEGFSSGGQILVTDETLLAAGDDVILREKGSRYVHPRGVHGEIRIHDVIGVGGLRIP